MSNQPSIELDIEELVLHGFPAGDRYIIAEALQGELTRLFTEHGSPPSFAQGGEINRFDAGTVQLSPASKPDTTGTLVARAVFGGLGR